MDIDSIFSSGGTWLKAEDLLDSDDVDLTIEGVEIKKFDDGKAKPILSFEGADKRLVVNKTNALMIAEVCGSRDTDQWIGKPITLFTTKVEYGGKLMDGIRVRPPVRKATGKGPSFVKKAQPQYDECNPPPFDDELPPGF
jgi:hypothetical protein